MGLSKAGIKYVQSLRIKKFRQKYHQFIVEGDKSVAEVLNSDWNIESLYYCEGFSAALPPFAEQISPAEMERLSQHQSPQKALAVVHMPELSEEVHIAKEGLTLALDGIQDPGNLGTLIRLCDWYGVKQVICSLDTVDVFNHKVISGTMGSFLRVQVQYTDLTEALANSPVPIYGAVMDGENIHQLKPETNAVLVIGNEGQGISDAVMRTLKHRISIPRFGQAESLNAAIAGGILLDRFVGA
ncbi:MAG: RNA methyltransferase [Bacteroidetes bacterium]|nr:MAG: RNA methyltransferase [Bacteroidota bacterium]